MTNITNFQDILGAANGDKTSVLGKFLYFSLANILVEKEALAQLCEDLNIPYSGSKRISVSDAFRSATGDIKDRITVKNPGEHHIYAVYCRDNAHTEDVYSRELVKETLTSGRINMKSWQTSSMTGATSGLGMTTSALTPILIP